MQSVKNIKLKIIAEGILTSFLLIVTGIGIYLEWENYKNYNFDTLTIGLQIYSIIFIFLVAWDINSKLHDIHMIELGEKT